MIITIMDIITAILFLIKNKMRRKLIYLASLFAITSVLILFFVYIYQQSKFKIFNYNNYSFLYNIDNVKIGFTEPMRQGLDSWDMLIGELKLETSNYEIDFILNNRRMPNSDAFTWFGQELQMIEENYEFIEKIDIIDEDDEILIACRVISASTYCNLFLHDKDDNLLYSFETSIFGFDYSNVTIKLKNNDQDEFIEISNKIKHIVKFFDSNNNNLGYLNI